MKNLLITLSLVLGSLLTLTGQTDYRQWESHRFKVKMGERANFEKKLADHNKKYHSAAPYKTGIFNIVTGPNSGEYELTMGPMTFTQMEGRPASGDHDADWASVLEHVESVGENIYWREDKDRIHSPAGSEAFTAFRWRYTTILPGERDRFEAQLDKIAAVYKEKKYPVSFRVYWRVGASQGPHVCTEMGMNSFAYFDQPNTWKKDFEEVHGEDTYERFYNDFELCIDRSKTYDELVKYNPNLSSN